MTIAMLLSNTTIACERFAGRVGQGTPSSKLRIRLTPRLVSCLDRFSRFGHHEAAREPFRINRRMLVTKIFGSVDLHPTLELRRPSDAGHLSVYENLGTTPSHSKRNGKRSRRPYRGTWSRPRRPLFTDPSSSWRNPSPFCSYARTRGLSVPSSSLAASDSLARTPGATTAAGASFLWRTDRLFARQGLVIGGPRAFRGRALISRSAGIRSSGAIPPAW